MNIKRTVVALSALTLVSMFSNVASAEAVAFENGVQIPPTSGTHGLSVDRSFQGVLNMVGPITVNCMATFDGSVVIDDDGLHGRIHVNDVTLANTGVIGLCGLVSVTAPFTSNDVPATSLMDISTVAGDVNVEFENVTVTPCGTGDISVIFNNNQAGTTGPRPLNSEPSEILFDDAELFDTGCKINGVISIQGNDLDIVND